ncbi:MAG: hypothetical protein EAZ08_10425 [Cytophagales bacterium]|nr:MAG: hypothetical protein EAZ08_10425 [Cytophagales bacterium]
MLKKILDDFFKIHSIEFYQLEYLLNKFAIEQRKPNLGNAVRLVIKKAGNNYIIDFQLYYKENHDDKNIIKVNQQHQYNTIENIPQWYSKKLDIGEEIKIKIDGVDELVLAKEKYLEKIDFQNLELLLNNFFLEINPNNSLSGISKKIYLRNNVFNISAIFTIEIKAENTTRRKEMIFSKISDLPIDIIAIIEKSNEITLSL